MKTKEDFFSLMSECHKSGKLPNGRSLSRENAKLWYSGQTEKYYFTRGSNHYPHPGVSNLYTFWSENIRPGLVQESRTVKVEQPKPIRNSRNAYEIDPSINILDEDLDFQEGENERIEPYQWNLKYNQVLIIGDLHIPYHDLKAIRTAINYGRKEQVSGIVINGDLLDLYMMSRFSKKPNKTLIKDELELGRQFLTQLRKLFPSEKIVFSCGNHDYRLEKYIHDRAPELFGIDAINLKELLKLSDLGIDYVQSSQIIQMGELLISHGHEVGSSGGINVARSVMLKVNCNMVTNHYHRTQEYLQRNAIGKLIGVNTIGCLCSLDPEYLSINQWNHGFGLVRLESDGKFELLNKKIIEGKVY